MQEFTVTGMSCAACQVRVEKAVSALPGVTSCSVNLLTGSMAVEGSADNNEILRAVSAAGYAAALREEQPLSAEFEADRETVVLKRRLLWSIGFLAVLVYLGMGHGIFSLPLPPFLENPAALGIAELLLTAVILLINRRFFISGVKSVLHGAPNMDTLVSLGASASFLWSVYALIRVISAAARGDRSAAAAWSGEFYFESAAMILTLITVGKLLEAYSKGKTTNALRALLRLAPPTATLIREGKEVSVPVSEVRVGDVFVLRPGDRVPVDGKVLRGSGTVDESALTGESLPVEKSAGEPVWAATVNESGELCCEAIRVGEDTTLSQIIRMVRSAAATKAPIAKTADRVSGVFVPVVLGIAAVTFAVWMLLGEPLPFALTRAVSVLVISCPCALGLATPVAIMVGSGVGAKNGILFKTAASLEETGRVQIAVLDKTGTVTCGKPEVTKILPAAGVEEAELIRVACSLEAHSRHPLAQAVVRCLEPRCPAVSEVTGFTELPGNGVTAEEDGTPLYGGSPRFVRGRVRPEGTLLRQAEELAQEGNTPMLFARGEKALGIIAVADPVKPESADAVRELEQMGIRVVLLTGDHPHTAQAVGRQVGISHIVAGVLPGEKEAVVRSLQTLGRVAMVGDGINDAPALTAARPGIAIGAGADVAIDTADVVLRNSRLSDLCAAVRLSRATLRNIRENLFWAFFYNVIGIPLAAGCWIGLLGWQMSPMFGAAAMSLSSFFVVSNALRLGRVRLHPPARERGTARGISGESIDALLAEKIQKQEEMTVKKTLKIEGMMCPHCEARVKKALEALEGVESAEVSHTAGTAALTLNAPVSDAALKSAVEEQGYSVLRID